jgi:Flp pilus assembly protein TadD
MIPKRDRHRQSAAERSRVAAELIEEAETLTTTGAIATPAEVRRAGLPPPLALAFARAAGGGGTPGDGRVADSEADGDPTDPLAALDARLALAPGDRALRCERAALLAAQGRYAAARRDLEGVLETQPDDVEVLTSLGTLLSRKALWGEAVPYLARAVELDAGSARAWHALGEALNHLDDLAGARGAYERAIALDPRHARALYGLGIVLDRLQRPDEATRMYRRSREAAGK